MAEMKSALIAMAIFVAFIVPFLFMISIGSLHQNAFMKITNEVTQVVKEEGGITEKVQNLVDELSDRGYTITFRNADGQVISGKQSFGETIVIDYEYTHHNVRGEEKLKTQSVVFVSRR